MMKIKLFLSFAVVATLYLAITACTGENNSQQAIQDFNDGSQNEQEESVIMPFEDDGDDDGQAERDRRDWEDAGNIPDEGTRIGPIDNEDDGQAERDRQDQEDLERERQEREKQEQQSGYRHEVGGTTFYTKHDLSKYLSPNERYPQYYDFVFDTLLQDIWCANGGGFMENSAGYSYSDGNDITRGLWVEVPDSENDRLYHMVTILYKVDGVEYKTSIRIYDCPGPYNENYYSIMYNYTHIIHKDMAPLILYALEQMEENPRNGALNDLGLNDNFYCN